MKFNSISIIFATLNEEGYIGRTLRSLKRIMHKCGIDAEIIVVDSSDNDRTFKAARRFADKVFRFKQRGISKARNFGASKARGDILVFMDADSIPQTCIFQDLVNVFKNPKYPRAAHIGSCWAILLELQR
jgi:glycosyltransferase involved in cell wall biosynthesis